MKHELSEDGTHREYHPNGKLRSEYTLKHGRFHGVTRQWNSQGQLLGESRFKNGTGMSRTWHDNGQLKSEFSYVKGNLCGRFRCWDPDGTFITQLFFFDNRQISKRKYDLERRRDPKLPRFDDPKPANSLGNYIRQLRRERRARAKLGPTAEQLQLQQWRNEEHEAETKRRDSAEALAWLRKKIKGERELGDIPRAEALNFIRKLYYAGAKKSGLSALNAIATAANIPENLSFVSPKTPPNAPAFTNCVWMWPHRHCRVTPRPPQSATGRITLASSFYES